MMDKTGLSLDLAQKQNSNSEKKSIHNNKNRLKRWPFIEGGIPLIISGVMLASLAIILFFVDPSWISSWGAPKVIIFGVLTSVMVSTFCIAWIFGGVGKKSSVTVIDIFVAVFTLAVVTVSLLTGDAQSLWGLASRMYDGAIIYPVLASWYYLVRYVVPNKVLPYWIGFVGILLMMSSTIPLISLIAPESLVRFAPTFSPLSGASHQVATLAILGALCVRYASLIGTGTLRTFFTICWWVSLVITFVVLELVAIPSLSIVWVVTLIILYFQSFQTNTTHTYNPVQTLLWGLPIIYGILTFWIVSIPVMVREIIPSFELSSRIVSQVVQNTIFTGEGTVQYGWSRYFPPELLTSSEWNLSIDTLMSESMNIFVRFGIIPTIILGALITILTIQSVRETLRTRTVSIEYILGAVVCVLFILIPFEIVLKILSVVILASIVRKIEKSPSWIRLRVGSFHISKLSPQVVSIGSVVGLVGIVISGLFVYQLVQVGQGFQAVSAALRSENEEQFIDQASRAVSKAPMYMEFGEILISERIANLETKLSTLDSENQEALEEVQSQIGFIDQLIAEYEADIPNDIRVAQSRIDILMLTHEYSNQPVVAVEDAINIAESLRQTSPVWDRYRAEYYAISYQKNNNEEDYTQALEAINRSLTTKPTYVEGTLLYADILSLKDSNQAQQIEVLERYITITQDRGEVSDQQIVYRLALEYQAAGQITEAQNLLTQLTRAFPEFTNAWFSLGQVYQDLGSIDEARQALERAQELAPESSEIQEAIDSLNL